MTNNNHQPAAASDEDALDTYLNLRGRGARSPEPGIDPALILAIRQLDDLASAVTALKASNAAETKTWEMMMNTTTVSTATAFPVRVRAHHLFLAH